MERSGHLPAERNPWKGCTPFPCTPEGCAERVKSSASMNRSPAPCGAEVGKKGYWDSFPTGSVGEAPTPPVATPVRSFGAKTPRFPNLTRSSPRLVRYTQTMPTAPDPAETDALRQFLAERDVACPGCGYNLRGSAGKQCPECGIALPNDFGAKSPRVRSG